MRKRKTQEELEVETRKLRAAASNAWMVVALLALLTVPAWAPRYEVKLFPVVTGFEITKVDPVDGGVFVSGRLNKHRGECSPTQVDVYNRYLNDGVGDIVFHASPTEPILTDGPTWRSRPTGTQEWGPWFIQQPAVVKDVLVFEVIHHCHFMWDVRTQLLTTIAPAIFSETYQLEQKSRSMSIPKG